MFVRSIIAGLGLLTAATGAQATDYAYVGQGRLLNNDFFGDGHDRWRTGGYILSLTYGRDGRLSAGSDPFDLMEFRIRAEAIAPRGLSGTKSRDRAFVGLWSLGAHSHQSLGDFDLSYGVDLVATGPQTGIMDIHESIHDALNAQPIDANVRENQVENGFYPTATAEIAREFPLGSTMVRPFAEIIYGVEDIARIGADVTIGALNADVAFGRDPVTGHRFKLAESNETGMSVIFGADYAVVGQSAYFPDDFGVSATSDRLRGRAGIVWQFTPDMSAFYGLTYLSEEYKGQTEGQLVGSLKLNLNF